jgi:hypothetical protein
VDAYVYKCCQLSAIWRKFVIVVFAVVHPFGGCFDALGEAWKGFISDVARAQSRKKLASPPRHSIVSLLP